MTFTESKRYFIAGSAAALLGLTFQGCGDSNTSSLMAHVERCAKQNMVEDHLLCEPFYKCVGTSNLQKCRDDEKCYDDLLEELEDEHCLHEPPAEADWCLYPDSIVPAYTLGKDGSTVDFLHFDIIEIGHRPIHSFQAAKEFAGHLRASKIKCDGFIEKSAFSGDQQDSHLNELLGKFTFVKRKEKLTGFKLTGQSMPGFKYVRVPLIGVEEQIDSATKLAICKQQIYPDGTSGIGDVHPHDDTDVDPAQPSKIKPHPHTGTGSSSGSASGGLRPGDSKKKPSPTPLPKPAPPPPPASQFGVAQTGNTCFAAGLMQLIRTMDLVPTLNKHCPLPADQEAPHNVCRVLIDQLHKMQSQATTVNVLYQEIDKARLVEPHKKITNWDTLKESDQHPTVYANMRQHDPDELFKHLLQAVETERVFHAVLDAGEFSPDDFAEVIDGNGYLNSCQSNYKSWDKAVSDFAVSDSGEITLKDSFEPKQKHFTTGFRVDRVKSNPPQSHVFDVPLTEIDVPPGLTKKANFVDQYLKWDGKCFRVNKEGDYYHDWMVVQPKGIVTHARPSINFHGDFDKFAQENIVVVQGVARVKPSNGVEILGVEGMLKNAVVVHPTTDVDLKTISEFVDAYKPGGAIRFRIDDKSRDFKKPFAINHTDHIKEMYSKQKNILLQPCADNQEYYSKITDLESLRQAWAKHKCGDKSKGGCRLVRDSVLMTKTNFRELKIHNSAFPDGGIPYNDFFPTGGAYKNLGLTVSSLDNGTEKVPVKDKDHLEATWKRLGCGSNSCTIRLRNFQNWQLTPPVANIWPFVHRLSYEKTCQVCGKKTEDKVTPHDVINLRHSLITESYALTGKAPPGPKPKFDLKEVFEQSLGIGDNREERKQKCCRGNEDVNHFVQLKEITGGDGIVVLKPDWTAYNGLTGRSEKFNQNHVECDKARSLPEQIVLNGEQYTCLGIEWQSGGANGGHFTAVSRRSSQSFDQRAKSDLQTKFGDAKWIHWDDVRGRGKESHDFFIDPSTKNQVPYLLVYRRTVDVDAQIANGGSPYRSPDGSLNP